MGTDEELLKEDLTMLATKLPNNGSLVLTAGRVAEGGGWVRLGRAPGSIAPKTLKPIRRQRRIADGILNVAVAQIRLQ